VRWGARRGPANGLGSIFVVAASADEGRMLIAYGLSDARSSERCREYWQGCILGPADQVPVDPVCHS
jgi:hypothetical protein